jgi:molybdopterin/thiamine biosynthesis adenylyltransferase
MREINRIAIIGCGGVTSHIMTSLIHNHHLLLFDGDKFEPHNTVRQIAAHAGTGKNKAETLAAMFQPFTKNTIEAYPSYIGDMSDIPGVDLLLVAVDNPAARLSCKAIAMRHGIPLIWGANELEDPQAMLFLPDHAGTNWDPYIRYDIKPDGTGPTESCTTTEAIAAAPQLPIANLQAGAFMCMMLNALMRTENELNLPAEIIGNRTSILTNRFRNLPKEVAAAMETTSTPQ